MAIDKVTILQCVQACWVIPIRESRIQMTTIITKATKRLFQAALNDAGITHHPVFTRQVAVTNAEIPAGTTFQLGCRFHSLLLRMRDRDPVSTKEKELLPWLNAIRHVLRERGVVRFEPEVALKPSPGLASGRCDLVLHCDCRSPSPIGLAEIKVCDELPTQPRTGDLLQLAGYSHLAATALKKDGPWVVLVYVSFSKRRIRLFTHESSTSLGRAALPLIAA